MIKFYALTKTDGGVEIMQCFDGADPTIEIERWSPSARARLTGEVTEVDPAAIPNDRTFRDAWTPALDVDMGKARTIYLNRVRAARDAELERLDIEALKAIERSDQVQTARIVAEKQKLRDLPQTFDLASATTPDELKASWPEGLETM